MTQNIQLILRMVSTDENECQMIAQRKEACITDRIVIYNFRSTFAIVILLEILDNPTLGKVKCNPIYLHEWKPSQEALNIEII